MPELPAPLSRRALLRSGLLAGGALTLGPGFYRSAFGAAPATPGPGPYGPVGGFDAHGLALPEGFSSRLIAVGGREVASTGYAWHRDTDGQATFPTADGGWILVSNSETSPADGGGSSMIRFAPGGEITEARRILGGTDNNCAGGPTPWGTWLSCEEHLMGRVWECDPTGARAPVDRQAMGFFTHEAVCVDPVDERLYMTEDERDGCLYRFTPTDYPDLSKGVLEVAVVDAEGGVTWSRISPLPVPPTRYQGRLLGAKAFDGGEGIWFDSGTAYFTTKGDCRVWAYDARAARLELLYDRDRAGDGSPLRSVDNVCVSRAGEVYVCEDGDNFEICLISADRHVETFARLSREQHGEPGSNETAGVVFDPSGTRMYFGVQRSFGAGAVYEVTGPFRRADTPAPSARSGPPSVRLAAPAALGARTLAERGLRLTLDLDEPAVVTAWLRAPRGRTVARWTSDVAVRDRVGVRLRVDDELRKALVRRTTPLEAEVTVVARSATGRRVVRRRVRLTPSRPRTA